MFTIWSSFSFILARQPWGRWLAVAQQIKDTLTIVGLNFALLFGLLLYGLPVPGLVLYCLRWGLVYGQNSQARQWRLWGLGMVHEALCVGLFTSDWMRQEMGHDYCYWLALGYGLGVLLSFGGLLAASAQAAAAHNLAVGPLVPAGDNTSFDSKH